MDTQTIILLSAVPFIISILFAADMGQKWKKDHPSKLGFKWGYFFIANSFLGNIIVLPYFIYFEHSHRRYRIDGEDFAIVLFGIVVSFIIMKYALKRKPWALILSTILTFNFIWMIINIAYLRNRWSEFQSESDNATSDSAVKNTLTGQDLIRQFRALEKGTRLVVFIMCSWLVCVPLFVFLFRPFGHMYYNSDYEKMYILMFAPPITVLCLYFIYVKFVR